MGHNYHPSSLPSIEEKSIRKKGNVSCNYPLSEGGSATQGCYEAEAVKPL